MVDEDTQLMLRVCEQGDASAFACLYTKYLPQVMAYLLRTVPYVGATEDIAQEVFTRLWARRCEYRGQAKFSTYLYSYVHLVCLEEKRARFRRRILAGGFSQNPLGTATTMESAATMASGTETNALLDHALRQLTAKQRTALRLYYTVGMSVPKAATAMGCSSKCFESRLTRGRTRLRFLLRAQSDTPGTSAVAYRKQTGFKKHTRMIEITEFGDVVGGTLVGCHCAERWQSSSCTWWFCAAEDNCDGGLMAALTIPLCRVLGCV